MLLAMYMLLIDIMKWIFLWGRFPTNDTMNFLCDDRQKYVLRVHLVQVVGADVVEDVFELVLGHADENDVGFLEQLAVVVVRLDLARHIE